MRVAWLVDGSLLTDASRSLLAEHLGVKDDELEIVVGETDAADAAVVGGDAFEVWGTVHGLLGRGVRCFAPRVGSVYSTSLWALSQGRFDDLKREVVFGYDEYEEFSPRPSGEKE